MLNGVMLLWFVLTGLSLLFVAVDIRTTPESPVLKWGFQALFMRDMAGGSYSRSLSKTFVPELLPMDLLMTGMVPVAMTLKWHIESAGDPQYPPSGLSCPWHCWSGSSPLIR